MMNFITNMVKWLGPSFLLLFLYCSSDGNIAGTGSSTGNAKVVGTIVDQDDNSVANAHVFLLPQFYNPVEDAPLADSLRDTTDSEGRFALPASDTGGIYNLFAIHQDGQRQMFLNGIIMTGDSIDLHTEPLDNPGAVKVVMPDTIDTAGAYVYIPGTLEHVSISGNVSFNAGNWILVMGSVPASDYPTLHLARRGGTSDNVVLSDSSFTVRAQDTVTVGTYASGFVFNAQNSGLPNNGIFSVAIDNDGSKWFGTVTGEIAHFDGNKWMTYNINYLGVSSSVLSIAVDNDGVKWFGTHDALLSFDGSEWNIYDQGNSGFPGSTIRSIAVDENNTKWFTTYTGGLVRFDGDKWTVYNFSNSGMPSVYAYRLAIDLDNSIWVGTRNGVVQYTGVEWIKYNSSNSPIPHDTVFSVAIDSKGHKWFGTFHGDVVRFDGTDWTVYNKVNSVLKGFIIHSIAVDRKDNIWCGAEFGQLFRFDNNTWKVYNASNSNIPQGTDQIYSIAVDTDNNKWIAMNGGGVLVLGPEMQNFDKY